MREDTILSPNIASAPPGPPATAHPAAPRRRSALWWLVIGAFLLLLVGPACSGRDLFPTTVWAQPLTLADQAVALGTRTGQVIVTDPANGLLLGACLTDEGRGGVRAVYGSPVTDGAFIYVGGYGGTVYAIPPAALTPDVNQPCDPLFTPAVPGQEALPAFIGGPALAPDGLLLIGTEGAANGNGTLYAIETAGERRGQQRWSFQAQGHIWSTPVVGAGLDLAYVGTLDGVLHAVRMSGERAGEEAWTFTAGAAVAAMSLAPDGALYVGSFDKKLYALDAATGQPRWPAPFQADNWFWAAPLLHEGRLYAPSLDSRVYILDPATGQPLAAPVDTGGAVRGGPALVGDRILVANEEGETWWIDTATGQAQAGGKLPAAVYAPVLGRNGEGFIYAQDGGLYRVAPNARTPVRVYPTQS